MQVVVNARFLAKPPTGVTRVGRELLRAIVADLAARDPASRPPLTVALPRGVAPPFALHAGLTVIRGASSIPEEQALALTAPGALHLNFCNTMPLLAPHTVIWLHDAQIFDAADTYAPAYRAWHQMIFHVVRARRARIVTVSAFSKTRLVAHGADPALVDVIHNGGDSLLREPIDESAAERFGLAPDGFTLVMGSRAKHKNLPFAIEALLAHGPAERPIAVVGLQQQGAYQGPGAGGGDPRVVALPQISDAQLRGLYRRARCCVVPSLFEGFGLPAAEAMWDDCPIALSDRASLPEVGGDAALYFDPADAQSLGAAVRRLEDPSLRAELRAKAAERRERFTWARAARAVIERYVEPTLAR